MIDNLRIFFSENFIPGWYLLGGFSTLPTIIPKMIEINKEPIIWAGGLLWTKQANPAKIEVNISPGIRLLNVVLSILGDEFDFDNLFIDYETNWQFKPKF